MSTDLIIARVDQARGLLAEAKDAQDAKRVADMAHAAEVYAKRQHLSEEAISYAHEIKIFSAFVKNSPNSVLASSTRAADHLKPVPQRNRVSTLQDVGISKKESAEAQFLADLKNEEPEEHAKVRTGKSSITKAKRAKRRKSAKEEDRKVA